MIAPASITISPVRVADLLAEGERMPVYVNNSLPIDLVDRGRVVLLVACISAHVPSHDTLTGAELQLQIVGRHGATLVHAP